MYRNQYDHDVTVWSPQGRIHQIEYAMEAVKQGSATVGLKNRNYAVLVALKRAPSDLASYQKKIIPVDEHCAVSIAGLTADGRVLSHFMRKECMNSRWAYDAPLPINRLVNLVASKMQIPTQRYNRRPFGVGILVAGYDAAGPHIYYQCPSANSIDCKALAIGARSQSARTYLERRLTEFPDTDLETLTKHGLLALRETLPAELDLNSKNCSLAIVGKDREMEIFEDEAVEPFLELIRDVERRSRVTPGVEDAIGAAEPAPEGADGEEDAEEAEPMAQD